MAAAQSPPTCPVPRSAPRRTKLTPLARQRWRLLCHLATLLDKPMVALSLAWAALVVLSLTVGLDPALTAASYAIWALFVLQFVVEFLIAPGKVTYLKRHWLTAIALVLPAFRLLAVVRLLRLLRLFAAGPSVALLRVVASLNRGMGALRRALGRRRVGFVAAFTALVIFVGAAGMLSFEGRQALIQAGYTQQVRAGAGFTGYGDALWWTAMIMTTMGSAYWPITPAGRILCFLLAVYAFAVFGYLTATIATFFIGKDRSDEQQEAQAARKAARSDAEALRAEITALNARLDALLGQPAQAQGHNRQGGQGQSPDGARPATQTETRQPALG